MSDTKGELVEELEGDAEANRDIAKKITRPDFAGLQLAFTMSADIEERAAAELRLLLQDKARLEEMIRLAAYYLAEHKILTEFARQTALHVLMNAIHALDTAREAVAFDCGQGEQGEEPTGHYDQTIPQAPPPMCHCGEPMDGHPNDPTHSPRAM